MIAKEEYGKEMSYEEAAEAGMNLIRYFDLLIKVDHRSKTENSEIGPKS